MKTNPSFFAPPRAIAIVGPSGVGKTSVAIAICECLFSIGLGAACIDKDNWNLLSSRIFDVKEMPRDRTSEYFKKEIRNYEMFTLLQCVCFQLPFLRTVTFPAPFSSEIKKSFKNEDNPMLEAFHREINARGGKFVIVYVNVSQEEAMRRMQHRHDTDELAYMRTPDKLAQMAADVEKNGCLYGIAPDTVVRECDEFIIYDAEDPQGFARLKERLGIDSPVTLDPDVTLRPAYRPPKPQVWADILRRLEG